jgi:hypothetical protein
MVLRLQPRTAISPKRAIYALDMLPVFWIALAALVWAQQPPVGNEPVRLADAGFIDRGKYVNPVLQLTIDVPGAQSAIILPKAKNSFDSCRSQGLPAFLTSSPSPFGPFSLQKKTATT